MAGFNFSFKIGSKTDAAASAPAAPASAASASVEPASSASGTNAASAVAGAASEAAGVVHDAASAAANAKERLEAAKNAARETCSKVPSLGGLKQKCEQAATAMELAAPARPKPAASGPDTPSH
jgi:hypothetical protein